MMNNPTLNKCLSLLRRFWPILVLLVFPLITFYQILWTHHATFFINPDNVDQFYSWYQKLATSIHHGYLPLWDANTGSGHSFVGEFQQAVFYPVNIVWCWLFGNSSGISLLALDWLVTFHFVLASIGMYFLARELGVSKNGSVIAALVYAYSGVLIIRSISQTCIFFGLCLIPWVILWAARYLNKKKWIYLILSGLFAGMIILSGHLEPYLHAIILLIIFLFFRNIHFPLKKQKLKAELKNFILQAVVIVGFSLIIAAPQLILSSQYLNHAYRFVGDPAPVGPGQKISFRTFGKSYVMAPHDFANFINPWVYPIPDGNNLFLGFVPLALLGFGLAFYRKLKQLKPWQDNQWFFATSVGFGAVAVLGYWTFVSVALYELPFVYQVRSLARYVIIIHFCLAIIVGLVVELMRRRDVKLTMNQRLALATVGGLVLINFAYLFALRHHIFNAPYDAQWVLLGLLFLAIALLIHKKTLLQFTLLGLVVLSMLLNTKLYVFKDNGQLYSPKVFTHTKTTDFLQSTYGHYRVRFVDNALPPNSGDVYGFQSRDSYGATISASLYNFLNAPNLNDIQKDAYLNVRYLVSKTALPNLNLVFFDQSAGLYVYETPQWYPRVYFASQLGQSGQAIEASNSTQVSHYGDLSQTYQTRSNKAETVIFSELLYPGWKVYVDGKAATLHPAPIKDTPPTFDSVDVSAGTHTIELRYL